ncbi:MAG: ATP-binding protein, partial [Marinilabiliales bacterium]
QLSYYPYIQLGVIFLFILVSYFAFSVSRKAEQNQVWVGMSKETAHQLGTPISSLLAWLELLKIEGVRQDVYQEVEKDVKRLETITERFSKIGSAPVLKPINIVEVIDNAVQYIKSRASKKIQFVVDQPNDEILIPLNVALFEWVIENICKNAIDAMDGNGTIEINVQDHTQVVYIDIKDTGKGIPKSKFKTIFQPGYTTKERGWGLGLSLTKRIIESYHSGKVFIKSSELGKGTVFRIALKR